MYAREVLLYEVKTWRLPTHIVEFEEYADSKAVVATFKMAEKNFFLFETEIFLLWIHLISFIDFFIMSMRDGG